MTNIDITKSQFLLRDLQLLQVALLKLNSIDLQIRKVYDAFSIFIQSPTQVDGDELKSVINMARDISRSYEKETVDLTTALDRVAEEVDHLILSQRLTANADLIKRINIFYNLAVGK